jgi:hypothetical protein
MIGAVPAFAPRVWTSTPLQMSSEANAGNVANVATDVNDDECLRRQRSSRNQPWRMRMNTELHPCAVPLTRGPATRQG